MCETIKQGLYGATVIVIQQMFKSHENTTMKKTMILNKGGRFPVPIKLDHFRKKFPSFFPHKTPLFWTGFDTMLCSHFLLESFYAKHWSENDNFVPLWKTIMPRLNGLDYKGAQWARQKDRPVIIQLTTMSLPVIPLVAITPSANANGGNDEHLRLEIRQIFRASAN